MKIVMELFNNNNIFIKFATHFKSSSSRRIKEPNLSHVCLKYKSSYLSQHLINTDQFQ